jgi:hypothetical protein
MLKAFSCAKVLLVVIIGMSQMMDGHILSSRDQPQFLGRSSNVFHAIDAKLSSNWAAPVDYVFLQDKSEFKLPLCFSSSTTNEQRRDATHELAAELRRMKTSSSSPFRKASNPNSTTTTLLGVCSTGRCGSKSVTTMLEFADPTISVKHLHWRVQKVDSTPSIASVIYVFDDPLEVALSMRKDMLIGGKVKWGNSHASHMGCKIRFAASAEYNANMLLNRDTFALKDHFNGYMQSHAYFPMLSLKLDAFYSDEAMRVVGVFINATKESIKEAWTKADGVNAMLNDKFNEKFNTSKTPRGDRFKSLSLSDQKSLLGVFGSSSKRVNSYPPVCIWPKVKREEDHRPPRENVTYSNNQDGVC